MPYRFLLFCFCLAALAANASDTVYSRAVSFSSEGYTLRGDLLLPQRQHKVPAIVFLVGSGGASSHRTNYKTMVRELLEKQLLPEGVALLYFDKRGVQLSDGRWQDASFYDRARDVKAAIAFLKTLPQIDGARIGVIGHSQGGWIAQLVAARYPTDIAFAISLAGPTFSVRQQLLNDFYSSFRCKGLDTAKAFKKALHKTRLTLAVTAIAPLQPQWKQLKVIRRYDPAKELKAITRPTLLLFGENDPLVSPHWSMMRMQALFGMQPPPAIRCRTIAGVNHGFEMDSLCGNGQSNKPYAPEFLLAVKQFVLEQVGSNVALQ